VTGGPPAPRGALPEVMRTARLTLRPWALVDVADVLAYAQDPEWSRFLRLLPIPYTPADAEKFVARQLLLDRVTHPSWAIVLEGTAVGGINARFDFQNALAEIGYSIARAHWGHGYVTEAAGEVIDAAFTTHPDLNRVCARADVQNTASRRVMEKVGMTREGVLRQSRVERGEAIDEAWYAILRHEWRVRGAAGK
jgi:ribosomal-protein-alanine N-acetyltransferase